MAALMLPAFWEGHASLSAIGATFAFFLWATVAAVRGRRRVGSARGGAIGDPFAMGLLMAVPYVGLGAGHDHGAAGIAATGLGAPWVAVLCGSLSVIVGWAVLRGGSATGAFAERVGFWSCLLMMVAMLGTMGVSG